MASSSPHVLIIRLDRIGDALALAPLLAALRVRRIPVDVVLCQKNAEAFAPSAARRVEVATFALRSSGRENSEQIVQFAASLSPCNYAYTLVATEDPSGYRLARALRSPHRIGFANGWGKPFKTLWVRSMLTHTLYRPALDHRGLHECHVLFELGRSLVAGEPPSRDPTVLRALVVGEAPERSERIAVQITEKWIYNGASFADLASLAKRLAGERGARLLAAASESRLADAIADACGVQVERFDSLGPWKLAIAGARAVVAPDSGATHVAGMTGTPTVAAYAADRWFEVQVARWHPWAAPYRAVRLDAGWVQRAVAALDELLS